MKIDADDAIVVMVSAKRTRAGGPVLRKGPFKGKRVELASTTGIEGLEHIADDFMLDIFGFEPGEYLITDLSSLHDFVGVDDMEFGDMLARIRRVYRLDVADECRNARGTAFLDDTVRDILYALRAGK